MCVCVCVTLSVNSPTGQTPRRIFTVDSLKDADLRKYDFWGLDDELSHLGVQSPPKKPILGACISQIGEKFKQLYLQICVSDWHEFWQAGPATETVQMVLYMVVKQFQDGGQPPFWKSIYRHLMKNHPIWMKCCTQQQILNWMNVMWSKIKKSCIGQTTSSTERISCLLLVTSASDLPVRTIRFCSVVFGVTSSLAVIHTIHVHCDCVYRETRLVVQYPP